MQYINRIILTLGLLALPIMVAAQSDEPQKKSEIKLNDLDVIYEEEEFRGVTIDSREQRGTETDLYQAPFIVAPPDDEDEFDELLPAYTLNDEGVESEDDILLEAFDTSIIHLPKLDPATIKEPILLQLGKFYWPTPHTARPTSHYGQRTRRRWHYGLDLAQPTGEPIFAAFDGVVRISKFNRSYGNLVIIHHSNGLETYYAHMSKRHVQAGDHVRAGQVIGLCGNTGRSRGSHLHFEIRYMGNAINPEHVVDCSTHDLVSKTMTITSSSFRKVGNSRVATKGGSAPATQSASSGWYRVRQGDTLEKIARRNGTTVKRLCQLNGISQNKVLHPGDRLKVSGSASQATASEKTGQSGQTKQSGTAATYTVRKGDTLYSIARAHGTTVQKLCQLNGISEKTPLRVGQKLKVK